MLSTFIVKRRIGLVLVAYICITKSIYILFFSNLELLVLQSSTHRVSFVLTLATYQTILLMALSYLPIYFSRPLSID